MKHVDVDLAVIGAGLAGCSLVARLQQHRFRGSIAVVEAGRGPGGRTATRRSRQAEQWRLDHGAPGFNLTEPVAKGVIDVLAPLRQSGILRREWGPILGMDDQGSLVEANRSDLLAGEWLRGFPTMARICEALLENTNTSVEVHFGQRVRWLQRDDQKWTLSDASGQWQLTAKQLVLSGNLLAHKRSLSMLAWPDVPLRQAVPPGRDPKLDQVISSLNTTTASIRWNLMLACNMPSPEGLPRQILLTPMAQERWGVERLVLHPQDNHGVGMVVHGLDAGQPIHPGNQEVLLKTQEQRLIQQLLGQSDLRHELGTGRSAETCIAEIAQSPKQRMAPEGTSIDVLEGGEFFDQAQVLPERADVTPPSTGQVADRLTRPEHLPLVGLETAIG